MGAIGEDVEGDGNAGLYIRLGKEDGIEHGNSLVLGGVPDKCRGSIRCYVSIDGVIARLLGGKLADLLARQVIEGAAVGGAEGAYNGVGIDGGGRAHATLGKTEELFYLLMLGGDKADEVSARGEADGIDAVGIDGIFLRILPYVIHSECGIDKMLGIFILRTYAIFENEAVYAVLEKCIGDRPTLAVCADAAIAAAGNNEHSGARSIGWEDNRLKPCGGV